MAISDRTRKLLWGRSGGACAICQARLTADPTHADDRHSVLGEECHITARSPGGPRYLPRLSTLLDEYENLILLCPTHHKLIDDQPAEYTADKIRQIKSSHEAQVAQTRKTRPGLLRSRWIVPQDLRVDLIQVHTGAQILELMSRTLAYHFHEVEAHTLEEAELQGEFLQDLADFGDIYEEIGPANQIREKFEMTQRLADMGQAGFLVLTGQYNRTLEIDGHRETFPTAIVKIVRSADLLADGGDLPTES